MRGPSTEPRLKSFLSAMDESVLAAPRSRTVVTPQAT